ncbi:MAG: relaxase/mobilization nuclease domain-containing protein [Vulcanimicrobiaceae bacterium]
MITKRAPKRRAGRGSFSELHNYLERDELGRMRADLVTSWSRGVAAHETAALEMEAVAQQRRGLADPVYQAKLAVDAVRRSLDADEHQYFAAMHHDVDTDRYHVHLAINKVSLRGRALNRWQDYAKLARAAEWCGREMGLQVDRHSEWRSKLGERDLSLIPEIERSVETRGIAQGVDRQEGATIDRRDAVRRTRYSWVELLVREAVPAAALAVSREGAAGAGCDQPRRARGAAGRLRGRAGGRRPRGARAGTSGGGARRASRALADPARARARAARRNAFGLERRRRRARDPLDHRHPRRARRARAERDGCGRWRVGGPRSRCLHA